MRRFFDWELFCNLNGIGNKFYKLRFEQVEQNENKIKLSKKFVLKPEGILFMWGTKGTGKSFLAMAICEGYTRVRGASCIYLTSCQLQDKWLDTFRKKDLVDNFINKIKEVELLVIDDFATAEPTPSFLRFFMDLIDTRLQWDNRGTVITTNLDPINLSKYCGDALCDRIMCGQNFTFEGESRR